MSAAPKTVPVHSAKRDYDVVVGSQLADGLAPRLRGLGLGGRVCVVTDRHVLDPWGKRMLESLRSAGFEAALIDLPPGEASKTLRHAEALYGDLIKNHFTRRDTLVSLGGGVIGDLAGFVAATYHRGIPLVHVPTSLLAQVDSSIGGKTAVDHPLGKNLIGAFHPPHLVLCDVGTLATLPGRERWSGLAEIVKAALIADRSLLDLLERQMEQLGRGEVGEEDWVEIVERAVRIKAEIVSEDEEESGRRTLLNFGHTLGHAVEVVAGYGPLSHGEAVVIGMRTAVEVSRKLGSCSDAEAQRAHALLSRFPRPPSVPRLDPVAVREAVNRDKKGVKGGTRFVILLAPGRAAVQLVDGGLLDFAVDHALSQLG